MNYSLRQLESVSSFIAHGQNAKCIPWKRLSPNRGQAGGRNPSFSMRNQQPCRVRYLHLFHKIVWSFRVKIKRLQIPLARATFTSTGLMEFKTRHGGNLRFTIWKPPFILYFIVYDAPECCWICRWVSFIELISYFLLSYSWPNIMMSGKAFQEEKRCEYILARKLRKSVSNGGYTNFVTVWKRENLPYETCEGGELKFSRM